RRIMALDREQNGTKGPVCVDRPRDVLGDAHGGRTYEKRPARVVGRDDLSAADRHLAMVLFLNYLSDAALNLDTKLLTDRQVEATVHDAEAVGRADHGICGVVEVVACARLDDLDVAEDLVPGAHQLHAVVDKQDAVEHPCKLHSN